MLGLFLCCMTVQFSLCLRKRAKALDARKLGLLCLASHISSCFVLKVRSLFVVVIILKEKLKGKTTPNNFDIYLILTLL